jgi:hypothetical protein
MRSTSTTSTKGVPCYVVALKVFIGASSLGNLYLVYDRTLYDMENSMESNVSPYFNWLLTGLYTLVTIFWLFAELATTFRRYLCYVCFCCSYSEWCNRNFKATREMKLFAYSSSVAISGVYGMQLISILSQHFYGAYPVEWLALMLCLFSFNVFANLLQINALLESSRGNDSTQV